jgi:hypothetical protein
VAVTGRVDPGDLRRTARGALDELEEMQPTIILDAKDGSGHDVSAVGIATRATRLVSGQLLRVAIERRSVPA